MEELLQGFLSLSNETLTAAAVVVTASLLLYNLSRNLYDRVARSSSVVLACVTIAYTCDVFLSLDPSRQAHEATLRLQWIGISVLPAAMFHLSDALLATTGLPSRGRRRRIIRILYAISTAFIVAAAFTNILIQPVFEAGTVGLRGSALLPVFLLYFALATGIAFINVQRARDRCLTRDTRRRMGYLQFAMFTPAFGVFPYSILLGPGQEHSLIALLLVNASNVIVILMLLFLAYPLAFFGSRIPDRVVKTELLQFVLRGPATGLLALGVIIFITPATRILGLPGLSFVPFAVVAVVLMWQWAVSLTLPWLEKRLIYPDENDDQLSKLQNLSEQLLTRNDLLQLLDAILAAVCDYLQVNTAFVISFKDNQPDLVSTAGRVETINSELEAGVIDLQAMLSSKKSENGTIPIVPWQGYWLVPLYSKRRSTPGESPILIGFMGIQARADEIDFTTDEHDTFTVFIERTARTLDDLDLQAEIYAALEGLLPQISMTRTRAAEVEYRIGYDTNLQQDLSQEPNREQFIELVRAALRHYWGGPGLTRSRLMEMTIVNKALEENDDNPARALRAVLTRAIESQRPEGERRMLSPEWTIYNILDLRFIERNKVRDVAIRLALSEPDLYRKQRIAIETVADTLMEMEIMETKS